MGTLACMARPRKFDEQDVLTAARDTFWRGGYKATSVQDLAEATALRRLGMSVTQATRVIAYRERQGGFESLDDLDAVPGIPKNMLAELKEQLAA